MLDAEKWAFEKQTLKTLNRWVTPEIKAMSDELRETL